MEKEQTFWIDVLDQLHKRLRQLALSGVVVLLAVGSEWFFRHEQVADEQSKAKAQLEQVVLETFTQDEQSTLAKEIHTALADAKCRVRATVIGANGIRPGCIPSLVKQAAGADPSSWKLYGQDLPKSLYRLLILFSPIVLLIGTIGTGRQLRRLHSLLSSATSSTSVQQKLNSPYFARVTKTYGEGWTSQILIAAAINSVHVLAAFVYTPAVLMLNNVVEVRLGDGKIIWAAIAATGEATSDALIQTWLSVIVCALALWVAIVFSFYRMVGSSHAH